MRSIQWPPIACAILLLGSYPAGAADAGFDRMVDDFVLGTLALSPSYATRQGYHTHHGTSLDDQLDDYSAAGLEAQRALLTRTEARLAALKAETLDPEERADVRIMRDAVGAARQDLDEIQSFKHNPTVYVELI